ncbi:hypothetical protein Q5P01_010295 [Channa striata]|uniref:Fucosyltransferase n=1 Tax=Channa striata TaxID=64152 RepID=A0AA88N0I0_CHASR|nr:hypothetical protein Q5P01_010295 [Channa striata]
MGAGGRTRHRRSALTRRLRTCVLVVKTRCCRVCVTTVGLLSLLGVCLSYLQDPPLPAPQHHSAATLLIWTHPFGRSGTLPDCYALYRIPGCTLTDDLRAYPHAEAVLIHHREVATGAAELPPEPRPRAQKWIWMNYESPTHTASLWRFEGLMNLTMSYRADSDIFLPYGFLVPRVRRDRGLQNRQPQVSRLLRPHLVAWVISNWSESHARVAFYYQLRRYIRVDLFGDAGRPVPEDGAGGSVVRLLRRYLFYLALENSQHTDYITEKLWNALRAGAVPVVLGPSRQNYEQFLPPEAFIHVEDFPTVRGLARYLLMLRRNPSQLRRHLDWRRSYSVRQPEFWAEHYCTACRAVRRSRGHTGVVKNLTRWFWL